MEIRLVGQAKREHRAGGYSFCACFARANLLARAAILFAVGVSVFLPIQIEQARKRASERTNERTYD